MNRRKPIKGNVVKRAPDVRAQIHAVVKARETEFGEQVQFLQDQLNAGDERIEKLKAQIVTTKRANNTTRVGSIAAVAAGTLATNLTILQGSETATDSVLKYAIIIGACMAGALMNNHFNKTDITMTEMLKRANAWSRQEFTPEEIQTFKELYDEVKEDFEKNPELKKNVKSNFVYQASQGVIFALAVTAVASAFDKYDNLIMDLITQKDNNEDNVIEIDPNDPILNYGTELKFPSFD